jgi:hypothetical protein
MVAILGWLTGFAGAGLGVWLASRATRGRRRAWRNVARISLALFGFVLGAPAVHHPVGVTLVVMWLAILAGGAWFVRRRVLPLVRRRVLSPLRRWWDRQRRS